MGGRCSEMTASSSRAKPEPDPRKWNKKWKAGKDKNLHFLGGLSMALVLGFLLRTYTRLAIWVIALVVLVTVSFVWYGKEIWDSMGNGCADIWDLWASIMGVVIGVTVLVVCWVRFNGKK